ncbi:MAG: hypothetical protein ACK4IK_00490 [Bacteroidia bacterium]
MNEKEALAKFEKSRNTLLPICLLMDIIGIFTYAIQGIGEAADFIWAPISGAVYYNLFKGKVGLFGGSFAFFEELIPGTDVIPSFTITWLFKFIILKNKTLNQKSPE